MKKGNMRFSNSRHEFNAETVYRALQHHEREGRITSLALVTPAQPGKPVFKIRLAASYDMDVLDFTVREAYVLNLGLVTMERLNQAAAHERRERNSACHNPADYSNHPQHNCGQKSS